MGVSWKWRPNEGMFWKFWSPLAGPGPQPIDPFYWLKVLLKTRSKSVSIEPFIDLLAYLELKLWVKKLIFDLIQYFQKRHNLPFQGKLWPAITRQQIQLESCSNPVMTSGVV